MLAIPVTSRRATKQCSIMFYHSSIQKIISTFFYSTLVNLATGPMTMTFEWKRHHL